MRYLSAKIKIEDKNGNLKMQINNKKKPKKNKTTSPVLPSGKKEENV